MQGQVFQNQGIVSNDLNPQVLTGSESSKIDTMDDKISGQVLEIYNVLLEMRDKK